MMLVLSHLVHVQGSNMFELADIVLQQAEALGKRIAVLVSVGKGMYLKVHSSNPLTGTDRGQLLRTEPSGANESYQVEQISGCLDQLDKDPDYGLEISVVVIGYAMVGRSASVRSERQVITHIIAAYRTGRSAPAVHQMLMRAGWQILRGVLVRNVLLLVC